MNRIYPWLIFGVISLFLVLSCDKSPDSPEYEKEITVFGYLWGSRPLNLDHAILIAYTQPIDQYYDLEKAAISNAEVTLMEVGSGKVFSLSDSPEKPGFYFNDSVLIRPKETYTLRVQVEGKSVTASTTVPPMLHLTTELRSDTVNAIFPKNISKQKPIFMQCESLEQIVLVDMYCNEEYQNAEYINPFFDQKYPNNREEYDGGRDGEPRHIMGMARLKEMVSDDFPGQYVIDWYSSMIVFYGSNTLQVLAIDDNYHKFIYTEHPERNGGIQGGIGVLGSVCGESFELMILKP
ncbi:MAG: hypothetical protein Kow0042_18450 [Calditrichia bacterium]